MTSNINPGRGVSSTTGISPNEAQHSQARSDLTERTVDAAMRVFEEIEAPIELLKSQLDRTSSKDSVVLSSAPIKSEECSPITSDVVLDLFAKGDLLLRGMTSYDPAEDFPMTGRLNFKHWDRELELMEQKEVLTNLSTTLLCQDCSVSTYTNMGLLFNGRSATIGPVFKGDACTHVDDGGKTVGDKLIELPSLSDLKDFIESDPKSLERSSINEVKADIRLADIAGLFFSVPNEDTSHNHLLALILTTWQKHIKEKTGIFLPIFMYKSNGTLTEYSPTKKELLFCYLKAKLLNKESADILWKELNRIK